MDDPYRNYTVPIQRLDPNLQNVSPGELSDMDIEKEHSSSTSGSPETGNITFGPVISKRINPIKKPNLHYQFCRDNLLALDVADYDEIVKENATNALKKIESMAKYWSEKHVETERKHEKRISQYQKDISQHKKNFYSMEEYWKRKNVETERQHEKHISEYKKDISQYQKDISEYKKVLQQKEETIKADKIRYDQLNEELIAKDNERRQNYAEIEACGDEATLRKIIEDRKIWEKKVAEMETKIADYNYLEKRYKHYKENCKMADMEIEQLKKCNDARKQEIDDLREEKDRFAKERKDFQKICNEKAKLEEMKLQCEKDLKEFHERIAALNKVNQVHQANMQMSERKFEALNAEYDALKNQTVSKDTQLQTIKTYMSRIAKKNARILQLESEKEAADEKWNAINQERSALELELAKAKDTVKNVAEENAKQKTTLEGKLEEVVKKFNAAMAENEILQAKICDLEKAIFVAVNGNEKETSDACVGTEKNEDNDSKAAEELNAIKAQYSDLLEKHTEHQKAYNLLKSEYAETQQKLKETEARNGELQKRITVLENLNATNGSNHHPQRKSNGRKSLDQIFGLNSINESSDAVENQEAKDLRAQLQQERDASGFRQAILMQEISKHLQEKKHWVVLFNTFTSKYRNLENDNVKLSGENVRLNGELKYYREAFSSSSNDEVVVPPKRKRKHPPPQVPCQFVQQQPCNSQLPPAECSTNNNIVYYSAFNNDNTNNPLQ